MLDFTHTFVLYSRKTLMRLVIGMFSLFLVPSSAAQIDCCVTRLTGLNLKNSFAKFTWQFGKCEWSVDTLVFCWNQKGEQFLILYFPLLLLIETFMTWTQSQEFHLPQNQHQWGSSWNWLTYAVVYSILDIAGYKWSRTSKTALIPFD